MLHGTAEAFANEFFQNLANNAMITSDEIQQASEFKVPVPGVGSGKKILLIVSAVLLVAWIGYRVFKGW